MYQSADAYSAHADMTPGVTLTLGQCPQAVLRYELGLSVGHSDHSLQTVWV